MDPLEGASKPLAEDSSISEVPDATFEAHPSSYKQTPYEKNTAFPTPHYHGNDGIEGDDEDETLLKDVHGNPWEQESAYADRFFAVLFIGHLAFILFLAFSLGVPNIRKLEFTKNHSHWSHGLTLVAILTLSSIIACLGSAMWLFILQEYARKLISGTIQAGIYLFLFAAFLSICGSGSAGTFDAVFFLVLAGVTAIFYTYVRKRIPFAAANLSSASIVARKFPDMIHVAYAALGVQFVWVLVWGAAMVGVWAIARENYHGTTLTANACVFVMLISFYWSMQVVRNVVHCIVAGTVGDWWYNVAPVNAVRRSTRRALTTSFGSICLGSLVVAVVRTLRGCTTLCGHKRRLRGRGWLYWIIRSVERATMYFNKYAFVQVALYGRDLKSSGYAATTLFRERGWSAVVNDDLISGTLTIGCLIVGSVVGLVGAGWMYGATECRDPAMIAGQCSNSGVVIMTFFTCFIVGFGMCSIVSSVLESAVATIFVCFAQDPATLKLTNPEEFNVIVDAWQQFHPNIMEASGPAYAVLRA